MSKYTPGPWFQTVTPAGKGKVVDANGFSVANTTAGSYSQQIVDAKLIAAAPKMYELLAMRAASGDDECRKLLSEIGDV